MDGVREYWEAAESMEEFKQRFKPSPKHEQIIAQMAETIHRNMLSRNGCPILKDDQIWNK